MYIWDLQFETTYKMNYIRKYVSFRIKNALQKKILYRK